MTGLRMALSLSVSSGKSAAASLPGRYFELLATE
jgi:hypothetical protein